MAVRERGRMMNLGCKRMMASIAVVLTLTTGLAITVPSQVEAASPLEVLAQGAVAMAYVSTELNKMDNSAEGQQESLKNTEARTGVLHDAAYQARAQRILDTLSKSPNVKRKYVVYVNPSTDVNAFMTIGRVMSVNKGTMDAMDDNELAYTMAHELAHGEHKDIINGMKKSVGLSTAVSAMSSNGAAALLGEISGNYLENQVFTLSQEKNADKLGFTILADSPYNLGGSAASMQVIKNKYGDLYKEGLSQVLSPNNHPKTSARITDNQQRMYEYSNKHVLVKDSTVYINNKPVYTGVASGQYSSAERADLVGGKLSRLYHGQSTIPGAFVEGSTVYIAGQAIVSTDSYASAYQIASAMNAAISAGASKSSK